MKLNRDPNLGFARNIMSFSFSVAGAVLRSSSVLLSEMLLNLWTFKYLSFVAFHSQATWSLIHALLNSEHP